MELNSFCQIILPVSACRQRTNCLASFGDAQVVKIFSPQITGEEYPLPGNLTLPALSPPFHATGNFRGENNPFPLDPRNRFQFWDSSELPYAVRKKTTDFLPGLSKNHKMLLRKHGKGFFPFESGGLHFQFCLFF